MNKENNKNKYQTIRDFAIFHNYLSSNYIIYSLSHNNEINSYQLYKDEYREMKQLNSSFEKKNYFVNSHDLSINNDKNQIMIVQTNDSAFHQFINIYDIETEKIVKSMKIHNSCKINGLTYDKYNHRIIYSRYNYDSPHIIMLDDGYHRILSKKIDNKYDVLPNRIRFRETYDTYVSYDYPGNTSAFFQYSTTFDPINQTNYSLIYDFYVDYDECIILHQYNINICKLPVLTRDTKTITYEYPMRKIEKINDTDFILISDYSPTFFISR